VYLFEKGLWAMKTISMILTAGILWGCGILSLLFPVPERYISRDIKPEELFGLWQLTAESQTQIMEFETHFPSFGIDAPWQAITLRDGNTCQVQWLSNYKAYEKNLLICSWQIANIGGLSNQDALGIEISFEYYDNHSRWYSLYIFEESNELSLWKFIGDPDDAIIQEFKKMPMQP
jgi:hypothetical protein